MTTHMLLVVAQTSEAVQKIVSDPPSGGVSPLAWTIIMAMGTVIAAMAIAIKVLYTNGHN